ncbi:hypothetical protein V5799_027256 [Amblyomma americanum]|uniref:Uncharacterized protein n=1 Tax=Amblyomma americanum TaxID=6943 RepID=A0AAQ4DG88_AMBAM
MQARTQLAVMHYNENSTNVKAKTAHGDNIQLGYNLLMNVVESCEGSSYIESFLSSEPPTLHHMTSHYNRPEKQDLVSTRHSTFSKTLPDALSLPALTLASSS